MLVSVWGQMIGVGGQALLLLIVNSQEVQAGSSYVGDKLTST